MSSLTWPDPHKIRRLNEIIFESQLNPFGIATYNPDKPVDDFVGRQEELIIFKEQIKNVIQHKKSRAVRLEGPGGVGKSTLFNFLKQSIEKERAGETSSQVQYLLNDIDIFSTYFNAPDQILDFSDIWKNLYDGLMPGLERETGFDISFPEYVAFNLIYRLFQRDPSRLAPIIWDQVPRPMNLQTVRLKDIIHPLQQAGPSAVARIQEYFRTNSRDIRTALIGNINGERYEIKKNDTIRILELFRTIDENDIEYLDKIRSGSTEIFKTSEDLIAFFNDLSRFYACASKKQPLYLIGIDEFAKCKPQNQADYFLQLGNLIVKLRNSLNFALFVLISTTDNWRDYDAAIQHRSDLKGQISGFIYELKLKSLGVEELIQVFRNRMNRFWDNYASDRSPIAPFFPFSEQVFKYVYLYQHRRLRESINLFNDLWMDFRSKRLIPKMETIFEAMQLILRYQGKDFDPIELQKFEWDIINKAFNDPQRFSSNADRSASIETGIERALKCLQSNQCVEITNVQNNPTISTPTSKRRPDVYITICGNLGAEFRRCMEFQVKAYSPTTWVESKHIESSLELFNEQYTDFIYFIITGKGLHADAEARVKELELQYPARIRRPPLNEDQINALYLLALYDEISGAPLRSSPADEKVARFSLETLLGQKIEQFLKEIKALPHRPVKSAIILESIPPSPLVEAHEETLSDAPTGSIITPSVVPLNELATGPNLSIQSSTPPSSPIPVPLSGRAPKQTILSFSPPATQVKWLETFPEFEPFRFELCALCNYLHTRETGPNMFKFIISTVEKNVITTTTNLDKKNFKTLVGQLAKDEYIKTEKSSYKLTEKGQHLYSVIKSANFSC